ncbi:alpha/beta hydrolase [Fictibacillus terranigra]|uniref:Alpha/beta hydrolase n=1 Tax=Fictibacillus terranigra TaxID=3058424 RepID=A0ABT8E718_9BACL|nr:alpha/beta hydrolase [Fictibacillus sp. CENA-BCM004]MDN4073709.1 alpha/beta hydrolase [Fictibacillus sp. CENA-BCM004]
MSIEERSFSLDGQWNTIHLPEQPNGFAVMIFGDCNHFVDNHTSLWKQNSERFTLIQTLMKMGYTVFYSHLYGRNWGNPEAVNLARRVYRYVLKYEVLNPKIHILAEGMGALTAIDFINDMDGYIRSAIFINPCLDLKGHFQQEKQNKLFLKRIRKEISQAYRVEIEQIDGLLEKEMSRFTLKRNVPINIFHDATGSVYPLKVHGRPFENSCLEKGFYVTLTIQMPGKSAERYTAIPKFFSRFESIL